VAEKLRRKDRRINGQKTIHIQGEILAKLRGELRLWTVASGLC
jgi:hypothetical protein